MKTAIVIEVESPDTYEEVFPEEGMTIDDFKGETKAKELKIFQSDFAHKLHKDLVERAKSYFLKEYNFEENWLDDLEELWVEGWDSFDDYKVKLIVN